MKTIKKGSESIMGDIIESIRKEKYPQIPNNLVEEIIKISAENREVGKVRKGIKKLINDNLK